MGRDGKHLGEHSLFNDQRHLLFHREFWPDIAGHPERLVRDGYQAADWVADDRRHLLTTGMGKYTRSGVIGRPSLGSAEKGKEVVASLVASFAAVLEILQKDS
jgi:hypothetical protein